MDCGKNYNMQLNPDPTQETVPAPEELGQIVEEYNEEYENIDSTLDQLDSCLDSLEAQNDDLYAKLQDLLVSSRQAREELEAENNIIVETPHKGTSGEHKENAGH